MRFDRQLHSPMSVRLAATLLLLIALPVRAADQYYDAAFRAEIEPRRTTIFVELEIRGDRLPSRIEFHIDPERHRAFRSSDPVSQQGKVVTWLPSGKNAKVRYEFLATNERSPKRYDSLVTDEWAVFRADKMVPRMAATSRRNLHSRTTLSFDLPKGWSAATAYPEKNGVFRVEDPERRHDRPSGWILAGKLGIRSEIIKGIQTIVAAPEGESTRRQDILAFLNWNLPHLKDVFPDFPDRLLVATTGDPMWRGGLSGPGSLFLHAERPLISENRTSTLLHELVHVAMGIRGDEESDWIVEGFAEYYSLQVLRRSGGIGRNRYDEAIERMSKWARQSPTVFARESSGATTARAVMTLVAADAELRQATGGRRSLDDIAAALAEQRGEVNLERLQTTARKLAGRDLATLARERLNSAAPRQRTSP
jgi:predicted metalloprotease with PDZ domain